MNQKPFIEVPPRDDQARIRVPQRQQKPASGSHANTPKKGSGSGVLSPRHTSAQEPLYDRWMENQTVLELVFDDGSRMIGQLRAYDTYAVHLVAEETDIVIFKQSLRWIRPVPEA